MPALVNAVLIATAWFNDDPHRLLSNNSGLLTTLLNPVQVVAYAGFNLQGSTVYNSDRLSTCTLGP